MKKEKLVQPTNDCPASLEDNRTSWPGAQQGWLICVPSRHVAGLGGNTLFCCSRGVAGTDQNLGVFAGN